MIKYPNIDLEMIGKMMLALGGEAGADMLSRGEKIIIGKDHPDFEFWHKVRYQGFPEPRMPKMMLPKIESFLNILGGEAGLQMFLEGEKVVALKEKPKFRFWRDFHFRSDEKGIVPEGFDSSPEYIASRLSESVMQLIGSHSMFKVEPDFQPALFRLVFASPFEFGLHSHARGRKIFFAAEFFGLKLCPWSLPLELIGMGIESPSDEELPFGMERIENPVGGTDVFAFEKKDGKTVIKVSVAAGGMWDSQTQFIFIEEEKALKTA